MNEEVARFISQLVSDNKRLKMELDFAIECAEDSDRKLTEASIARANEIQFLEAEDECYLLEEALLCIEDLEEELEAYLEYIKELETENISLSDEVEKLLESLTRKSGCKCCKKV